MRNCIVTETYLLFVLRNKLFVGYNMNYKSGKTELTKQCPNLSLTTS